MSDCTVRRWMRDGTILQKIQKEEEAAAHAVNVVPDPAKAECNRDIAEFSG